MTPAVWVSIIWASAAVAVTLIICATVTWYYRGH